MTGPILELRNVSKSYGPVTAVSELSLELAKGEFLSLLGPSGSGKTTTLMMISGLLQPTTGDILLEGRPITPLPPYKRNIGVVFQNYALFPHLTLAKNIAFPLTMRKAGRSEIASRVRKVLELVGLANHGGRYPRQLSGGQQQRVALARAMVFEPPILLMDEPLGALDKKLREQMQLEIKRLHRELDMSIIYVTHDQEEALVMSDRIAVFNLGRLQQVGTPTQLYERPATRFVAEFIGESNMFPAVAGTTANGFSILDTAGVRLRAVAAWPLQAGARVVVSIRPERIALQPGDAPSGIENAIAGRITEVVYLGRSRKYVIRTDAGQEIVSFQQARSGSEPDFELGAAVSMSWRAEDANVLPAD
ncbi:MAG TPA: ABC transporter ATP-binding protein [Stellaceae bacterium]|nr:ABC transporter ATP-binding protein [Stellaceae bacterium]